MHLFQQSRLLLFWQIRNVNRLAECHLLLIYHVENGVDKFG